VLLLQLLDSLLLRLVSGFGFRISGFGFRVMVSGFTSSACVDRLRVGWLNGALWEGITRTEYAQGKPTQRHISPSMPVYAGKLGKPYMCLRCTFVPGFLLLKYFMAKSILIRQS